MRKAIPLRQLAQAGSDRGSFVLTDAHCSLVPARCASVSPAPCKLTWAPCLAAGGLHTPGPGGQGHLRQRDHRCLLSSHATIILPDHISKCSATDPGHAQDPRLYVACSGSGKTAAFALPLLERLLFRNRRMAATYVLVLTPTRELAVQAWHLLISPLAESSLIHQGCTHTLPAAVMSEQTCPGHLRRLASAQSRRRLFGALAGAQHGDHAGAVYGHPRSARGRGPLHERAGHHAAHLPRNCRCHPCAAPNLSSHTCSASDFFKGNSEGSKVLKPTFSSGCMPGCMPPCIHGKSGGLAPGFTWHARALHTPLPRLKPSATSKPTGICG